MANEQAEPVFRLYEAGPEKVRTFDEWFADYLDEASLRAHRRGLTQAQRDRLARGLWNLRRKNIADKKSGRIWRGPLVRM